MSKCFSNITVLAAFSIFSYLVFLKVHLHNLRSHCPHDLLLVLLDDILHEGYPAH